MASHEPITEKQIAFIADLLAKRDVSEELHAAAKTVTTRGAASAAIDELLACPRIATPVVEDGRLFVQIGREDLGRFKLAPMARGEYGVALVGVSGAMAGTCYKVDSMANLKLVRADVASQPVAPDVPAGHYAVESATGNNDLDFYRVDRPAEGAYTGRTFVKRVIGGRPDSNIRGAEQRDALERIAADPKAASRYGQELGRCCRCNRHLTDETSRALGIGPECRRAS